MKEHIIYEYQIKHILNALKLTANYHKSRTRTTCFDRDVMDSIEMLNNVMNGEPGKRVNRFQSGKNDEGAASKPSEALPKGTLLCPKCNSKLFFECAGPMRVVRNGFYESKCPKCNVIRDVVAKTE